MKKYIDTGKIRTTKIFRIESYCDVCGKKLDKDNHGIHYRSGGTKMHTCKNNPKCNPFHKNNN